MMARASNNGANTPLIEVRDLKKHYAVTKGVLSKVTGWVRAVDGVSLRILPGEVLTLVGESGCGKSTLAKCILLLEKLTSGQLLIEGKDSAELSREELRNYRRMVQAVFQDPYSSLNPRLRVGTTVAEPLVANSALPSDEVKERTKQIMEAVGLDREQVNLYPHEFSGGQRQRISLARALILQPRLMILDEPMSALDVSIRAQVMNLLKDLREEYDLSYLLIAHDLATVRYMSSRVAVMYLGKIVETASSEDFFSRPLHPYAQALLQAALPYRPARKVKKEVPLIGEVPSPLNPPSGCRFHPRCPERFGPCSEFEPKLLPSVGGTHQVACHLYEQ